MPKRSQPSLPMLRSRRQTLRLLQPVVQLRLPFYLLIVTVVFTAAFSFHTSVAFDRIYEALASFAPKAFKELIHEQSRDFLIVSGAIAVSYVLLVLGICIAYVHRLIGPIMALRRHVEALQNGEYSARVGLRKTDVAFRPLAEDLDELARILENNAKGVS